MFEIPNFVEKIDQKLIFFLFTVHVTYKLERKIKFECLFYSRAASGLVYCREFHKQPEFFILNIFVASLNSKFT